MSKSICKIITVLFFCLTALPLHAEEYIQSFNSDIVVNKDGSLDITETIVVHHEGQEIQRGIYRDFSILKGEQYNIIDVTRNYEAEPWFTEKTPSALRVNTGNDNFLPSPADSTFIIRYTAYNMLRKIPNEDLNELYLNLTGKWNFPIKKVTAAVYYPEDTNVMRQYSYQTNRPKTEHENGAKFEFENLPPHEEITIAQAFTTGTVKLPVPPIWKWLIASILATIIYYLIVWYFYGKDPAAKAIVPDWEEPDMSPLECAYIKNNGRAPKDSFFLHVLWLLHKNAVKVMETDAPASLFGKKKWFTLTTQPEADKSQKEIQNYCEKYPNILTLTGQPSEKLADYINNLNKKIDDKLKQKYYKKRSFLTFLGTLVAPIITCTVFADSFLSGRIALIIVTCFILLLTTIEKRGLNILIYINLIPFFIPLALENIGYIVFIVLYVAIISVFSYLMFQPTIIGQRKIEKIKGLEMFLKAINDSSTSIPDTENKGLSMEKRLTPRDMETLFPYAVALGLEKSWEKKFKTIFGDETYHLVANKQIYNDAFRTNFHSICNNTAIPPVSHSAGMGSSGHGFAGGGFGGGGGGGR